ncbi:MAG: DUF2589 domain-containing protein [Prevotellaceae bacterium]|jgi:hypothetical protein|nr:DUF2589 domain-containing protein [Prevotellaceae bacterium]
MAEGVAKNFQGLPIAELISAPLRAACDSQKLLAQSAYEFMTQIGFSDKDKARLLEFNLQRPIEGQSGTSNVKVNAPFLGLVPIPSLLIDDVQIDFQMEVTDTATSKDTSSSEVTTDAHASFNFGFFGKGSVDVHGKVTSSRENTRSTNQTAKYQVHVSARQQRPTEGLSKLMDIMAACIEPIPASK